MDRRTFLASAGALAMLPVLPASAAPVVANGYVRLPDERIVHRMLSVQRGAIREVHRVTGIPRYKSGRDTWQDQVDAGESVIVQMEPAARDEGKE